MHISCLNGKGEITVGIYPLLLGDNCSFLAIDFDKSTYEKDVNVFWEICDELNIPVVIYKGNMGKKLTKETNEILAEADKNNSA